LAKLAIGEGQAMRRNRLLLRCIFIAPILIGIVAISIYFIPWRRNVHISGIVVDLGTNLPIAKARIIVTLRKRGFPYDAMIAKYGLITDARGRFALDRQAPRRYHDMWIEASTPSDNFGSVNLSGESEDVVVKTDTLPNVLQGLPRMHYGAFAGGAPYMGIKRVEFINEDWSSQ
jgi:hypothetical protein